MTVDIHQFTGHAHAVTIAEYLEWFCEGVEDELHRRIQEDEGEDGE